MPPNLNRGISRMHRFIFERLRPSSNVRFQRQSVHYRASGLLSTLRSDTATEDGRLRQPRSGGVGQELRVVL